jgi:hypothetical protein
MNTNMDIPSGKVIDVSTSLQDLNTCIDTMREVDEMGHAAARRGDFERALQIWRASSSDGNENSQTSLCIFHMMETTPTIYRDHDEGFDICSSLALDGAAGAQYVLARMYGAGIGVEKDETKALYWFNRAAEGGDEQAQFTVGLSYLAGTGVPKDLVLAYKWLNLAAGNGVEKAHEWRDLVASSLTRSELSEAQTLTRSYTPHPISGRDICSKWLAQRQEFY